MPRVKVIQTNFTAGVLAPLAAAREDIVFYYNGLEDGENLEVIPEGGCRRRPGMEFVRELAHELEEIPLAGATVTAPNGGEAVNVYDGDAATFLETESDLGDTDGFVIVKVEFADQQPVDAVDIINFKLAAGALAGEVRVRYSTDDAVYHDYGTPFGWDEADRSRRRRAGAQVAAKYWVIERVGDTDIPARAMIGEIRFWKETAELSDARLIPFAYSTEQAYMMAVSGGNIDVLSGRDYTGSIAIAHTSGMMRVLNFAQSLDTLVLFHRLVQPTKIFRQGADDEFDFRLVEFDNIPQHDYGAGVGGIDEVQTLNFGGMENNDKFTILLEGKRTGVITTSTDLDVLATNIKDALSALPNVDGDGISAAAVTNGIEITFGGENGKQAWGEMSVSVLLGNEVFDTSRTTEGEEPGEDIMSDLRGWPRCGVFDQDCLIMAGIGSLPSAIIFSVKGAPFNLDIDQDDALKALLFRANSNQVSASYQIVAGRHLTNFTNDTEFYFASEPITDSAVLKSATKHGIKEGLPVYEVDGALIFVQGVTVEVNGEEKQIGTSLREFLFDDTVQTYTAADLSKLSAHLIKNPVDFALRKAASTEEADIMLLVNEDGSGVSYTTLRDDVVNAFMPFTLNPRKDDRLIACAADKRRRVYFITERLIGGARRRYIEAWNDELKLDCGGKRLMTFEDAVAGAAGQSVYGWGFDSPATAGEIGVRLNGGRLPPEAYAVDLGAKTVTLSAVLAAGIAAGDTVRISILVRQLTGLDHLEGEEISVRIDGTTSDNRTIAGGILDLGDEAADTSVEYGFDFTCGGRMMPFRIPGGETLADQKVRVVKAIFSLYKTGGLQVRLNGGAWQDLGLVKMDDDILDRSTDELLFTGEISKGGLGWATGGYVEFRTTGPEDLTLRAITREVSF
jgi:hypothetical protein